MKDNSINENVLTSNQAKWIKRALLAIAIAITFYTIATHYMTFITAQKLKKTTGEVIFLKERIISGVKGGGSRKQIVITLENWDEYFFDDDQDSLLKRIKDLKKGDNVEILHTTSMQSLFGPDEFEILQIKKDEQVLYSLNLAKKKLASERNTGAIIASLLWLFIWSFVRANRKVLTN